MPRLQLLRWLAIAVLVGGILASVGQGQASAATPLPVQRVSGTDAIGTSIAVSETEFPTSGSAKAVVLARSDFFSDALAGGPLAVGVGGPLLITPGAAVRSSLDPRVQAEIQRVLPPGRTVYILGGDLALGHGIDAALQALGYVTQRVAGANEFGTAVDIAEQLGNPSTVFEATGLDFADALSAVPAAIAAHGAILLTDGTAQARETAAYLSAHPSDTRYAIGGPSAALGADRTAIPVYGQDRYGTSAAVAKTFFPGAKTFGAATGTKFPDALSGGAFMGSLASSGPVLLVGPSGPVPLSIAGYLAPLASSMTQGYLFGGSLAVSDAVLSELEGGSPSGLEVGPGSMTTYTIQPQPPAGSCHYGHIGADPLPDPSCTPGAVNPQVTQGDLFSTVCRSGYTSSIRPPVSITDAEKSSSAAAYSYTGSFSTGEYDHLIPLELGGDPNDAANLWVEPNDIRGATTTLNSKDVLENKLNSLVCSSQLTLAAARQAIASNWVAAFETYVGPLPTQTAPPPTTPPSSAAACTASISNPTPGDGGDETVTATSNVLNTAGVVSVHYKTTTHPFNFQTDGSGSARVTFSIGTPTIGFQVAVDVTVGSASCSTAFTPQ